MVDYKKLIGILLLIVTSTIIMVQFKTDLRMKITDDYSKFYVYDGRWKLAGTEYNKLFEGTKSVYRYVSLINRTQEINGNQILIKRFTPYRRVGCNITDEYLFDGSIDDIELFPINHKLIFEGCKDLFYRYQVEDLKGITDTDYRVTSPQRFDLNMKVEWDSGYNWAHVYKNGKLKVQWKIPNDYYELNVRLFDPTDVNVTLYLDGLNNDAKYEYQSFVNISANSSRVTGVTLICYQETANISTSCGGLSNGSYADDGNWNASGVFVDVTYDGDYSTFSNAINGQAGKDAYLWINYSKPENSNNDSLWQIKNFAQFLNITIDGVCFEQEPLQFQVLTNGTPEAIDQNSEWFCHNSSDWITIHKGGVSSRDVYEEAMQWNINTTTVCIDLDAPNYGVNYSCGKGETSFIYNITTLRQNKFNDSKGDYNLNESDSVYFEMDNRTDIQSVSINITSVGTTNNTKINGESIRGTLRGDYLEDNEFSFENVYYTEHNISYTAKGKKSIYLNLSANPNNLTFQLSGFDIDKGNDLNYNEYFNDTDDTTSIIELGLADGSEVMGKYDNFETNITPRWTKTNNNIATLEQTTGESDNYYHLFDNVISQTGANHKGFVVNDGDSNFNFSNYERVDFDIFSEIRALGGDLSGISVGTNSIILTDGTNEVILKKIEKYTSNCFSISTSTIQKNISMRKQDEDHYYILEDDLLVDTVDVSTLSNTEAWYIKLKLSTVTGDSLSCSINSEFKIYNILGSGLWLNKTSTGTEFDTFGTMRSGVIANTTVDNNYTAVSVFSTALLNDNITYEISARNGSIWEDITSFVNIQKYVLSTQGNELAWRVNLSGTNETSPTLYSLNINVVSGAANNVSVDFGGDGSIEFTFTGELNSTNSPQTVSINQTNLRTYNNTFTEVEISTADAGQIQVDNLTINSSANPVILNRTDYDDCSVCQIDFSFDGDNMTVSDLRADFLGSWNYTALAHFVDYSFNVSHIIQILYSKFNVTLPTNINWYDVFPSSNTQNNVTPLGQKSTVGIWNVTSDAYDEGFDVYVKTNDTLNSCLNITYTNQSNYNFGTDYTITLNNSYQKVLHNITPSGFKEIWNYWNLNNCSNRFEYPWVHFSVICSGCVFNQSYLDEFNFIAE